MKNKKPQPAPKAEKATKRTYAYDWTPPPENDIDMTKAESLDIIYKIAAERKQGIASGNYHTLEESRAIIALIQKAKRGAK